jgi:transposase
MDNIIVGIDVSKDRLDIAVRPGGEAFAVERNAAGLELLTARLRELSPHIVANSVRRLYPPYQPYDITLVYRNVIIVVIRLDNLPRKCFT